MTRCMVLTWKSVYDTIKSTFNQITQCGFICVPLTGKKLISENLMSVKKFYCVKKNQTRCVFFLGSVGGKNVLKKGDIVFLDVFFQRSDICSELN